MGDVENGWVRKDVRGVVTVLREIQRLKKRGVSIVGGAGPQGMSKLLEPAYDRK